MGLSIFTVNDVVFTFTSGVATQTGSNDACSLNESYGSVNSHGLWACANTNNPYKVGDGSIFIPDFPRFVMNDDVQCMF